MSERQTSPRHVKTVDDFYALFAETQTIAKHEDGSCHETVDQMTNGKIIYTRRDSLGDGNIRQRSYLLNEHDPRSTVLWQRFEHTAGVVSSVNLAIAQTAIASAQRLLTEYPITDHEA